jgi:hydroxymethylglutaryl-CoA lyase
MIEPRLFDVSLRDGIQSADPSKWSTDRKKETLHQIVETKYPCRMEIGSLVSPKILPIMSDSLDVYTHARDSYPSGPEMYVLVPSSNRMYNAIHHGIRNMSFITSVSNAFQVKNTNRTLEETKLDLNKISGMLVPESSDSKIASKLYISCINECPLSGKIDMDFVLREVLMYHKDYLFDELCLSDTCGTLTFDEYEYLLDALLFFGVPASKLSLHLHVSEANMENIYRILYYSFDKQVVKFDVSLTETGGCSVTMNPGKCLPNLSYDLFYEILAKYIETRVEFGEK